MSGQAARPLTPRGEKRRRAILDAAGEVFIEHGFAAASLDMVIERAGGSRRMLYERFGGKHGLFVAAVGVLIDRLLGQLSALSLEPGDPEEDLTRAGIGFLGVLLEPRTVATMRMALGETNRFPELGERCFEAGPMRGYAIVADYLRRQGEAGLLDVPDPALSARQFIEMVKGDLHLRALLCPRADFGEVDIEARTRTAVRTFLHGVAAAQPPREGQS